MIRYASTGNATWPAMIGTLRQTLIKWAVYFIRRIPFGQ